MINSNINTKDTTSVRRPKWIIYLLLTASALIYAVCTKYFVLEAEIYTPGFNGIATGMSYFITDFMNLDADKLKSMQMIIYWAWYLMFNIPVLFLMWRWYGQVFFVRTLYVFSLNFIISMILSQVNMFADAQIIPPVDNPYMSADSSHFALSFVVRVILLGAIGGALFGISVGTALRSGGSTGGFDPISKYLSREKGFKLTRVLFILGIFTSFIFIFARYYSSDLHNHVNFVEGVILSPQMVSTLIFLSIYSLVAGILYSSNKRLELNVTSQKVKEISKFFIDTNYHRGHTILKAIGGYSKKETEELRMVINVEELADVTEDIISIDQEAFITVKSINQVYDQHDWKPQTKYDKELRKKQKESYDKRHKDK